MMHFYARRIGLALLPFWCMGLILLWPRTAMAMNQLQYVKALDWASIVTAVGIAVAGGTAPTLLALMTDSFVLQGVVKRTVRDIVVAAMAGFFFVVCVLAVEAVGYDVPDAVAFVGLLVAGWLRRSFFELAGAGLKQLWGGFLERLSARAKGTP